MHNRVNMKEVANVQHVIRKHDTPSTDTGHSSVSEKRILARERFRSQLIDRSIKGPTRWTRYVTDVNITKFRNQFPNFRNHANMACEWQEHFTIEAHARGTTSGTEEEICPNQCRTMKSDPRNPTTHNSDESIVFKLPPVDRYDLHTFMVTNGCQNTIQQNSTSSQRVGPMNNRAPNNGVTSGSNEPPSQERESSVSGRAVLALMEVEKLDPVERTQKWVAECGFGMINGSKDCIIEDVVKPLKRVRFGADDWLYKDTQFLFD